jgi:hypothetical protein
MAVLGKRAVHFKTTKDYKRFLEINRPKPLQEAKIEARLEKLEKQARGHEKMIFDLRTRILTKK